MWSKAKNGLVQPSKQGRTSPLFIWQKREISRDLARKKENRRLVEPPIFILKDRVIKQILRNERASILKSLFFCFPYKIQYNLRLLPVIEIF